MTNTGFLDGEDPLYDDLERVMTCDQGRQGNILYSRTEFGRRVYTIKDDEGIVFEAAEDDLISIW
jgi:hypothetical protein